LQEHTIMETGVPSAFSLFCNYRYRRQAGQAKIKHQFCTYSNLRRGGLGSAPLREPFFNLFNNLKNPVCERHLKRRHR
jgi:hypothetical protein